MSRILRFYVSICCNLNHDLALTAAEIAKRTGEETKLGGHQVWAVVLCVLLIFAVMGSIYGGITSVTEAAAVGVFGATAAAVRFQFLSMQLCPRLSYEHDVRGRNDYLADSGGRSLSLVSTI